MDKDKFGSFLAKIRTEKKLTQEQLAEKLNVSSKTISKWECGTCIPDFETMFAIAEIFNLSVYELGKCQQIDNPLISKNDIKKIINKKSIRNLILRKTTLVTISFLVLAFLIFSVIYTLRNYAMVEVHKIYTTTENFYIEGFITKTNSDYFLSVTKISHMQNDELSKINIKEIRYFIMSNNKSIYEKTIKFGSSYTFDDALDRVVVLFNSKYNTKILDDSKMLIEYVDLKNNTHNLEIKMNFTRLYINSKLKYQSTH